VTDLLSPIVVSRVPREPGPRWSEAKSWFGGQPRLGDLPWPRGRRSGKPLAFAAQIDLGELVSAVRLPLLPSEGSLAFFLEEGAVVHVPPGRATTDTPSPSGIAALSHAAIFFRRIRRRGLGLHFRAGRLSLRALSSSLFEIAATMMRPRKRFERR